MHVVVRKDVNGQKVVKSEQMEFAFMQKLFTFYPIYI